MKHLLSIIHFTIVLLALGFSAGAQAKGQPEVRVLTNVDLGREQQKAVEQAKALPNLEAGRQPSWNTAPTFPSYTPLYQRKLKNGGLEFCRFARGMHAPGNPTLQEDCYPAI